jgi:DNA-binding CsgD family transcriptional regulator
MLGTAQAGPLDELQLAHVDLVKAQVAFAVSRGSEAPLLLLKAAKRLEPLDVAVARETYLDAVFAALFADRLGPVRQVAEAAQKAPAAPSPTRPADLFLDGVVAMVLDDYAAAAPTVTRALRAFHSEGVGSGTELRWIGIATQSTLFVWDFDGWRALAARQVQLTRDAGALATLHLALIQIIFGHVVAGDLAQAGSVLMELKTVTEATGSRHPLYCDAVLAAWQGREAESSRLIEASLSEAVATGEGLNASIVQWATAVICNGVGRYEEAVAAADQASEDPPGAHRAAVVVSTWGLIELVEAAARCGELGLAADAVRRLSERTRPSGTDWALGIDARSQALLSDDERADELYREAIERLGRGGPAAFVARTHLVYGEWLRRKHRRMDAREHLRTAYELCSAMGLEAFAQRAARELRATGETARPRSFTAGAELTAQEAQIARLAGEGLSNPEIGGRLFISPRTVQYHLHKVFSKLNITSRHELGTALGTDRTVERS